MEWKKEKISSAELEKRQKEYMNEALAMMKRGSVGTPPVTPPVTSPVTTEEETRYEPEAPEPAPTAVELPEKQPTAQQSDKPEEVPAEIPEETPSEVSSEAPSEAPEQPEGSGDDGKYGVYTADELMNGEYKGDGLKKAAEILEEMTRSTEMMRKIASGDDDPDTTDFPEFHADCEEGDEGQRFREEESAEAAPEETNG